MKNTTVENYDKLGIDFAVNDLDEDVENFSPSSGTDWSQIGA